MRKYLLLSACGLLTTKVLAQKSSSVPDAVQQTFRRTQPRAAHVTWQTCPLGYEAAFEQQPADRLPGGRKLRGRITFTPTGELVETRLDVTYRTFPVLGRAAVSQQYPHREVDRIIRVVNAQAKVSYEVKICQSKDKNGKDQDCQTSRFDENGRPLPTL